jgi:hypothetical protein
MEKSQQRGMIDEFLLKGWSTRKISKELTDTLGSDVYSQAQISRGLARFSTGGISCLVKFDPEDRFQSWDHYWNISWNSSRSPVCA